MEKAIILLEKLQKEKTDHPKLDKLIDEAAQKEESNSILKEIQEGEKNGN